MVEEYICHVYLRLKPLLTECKKNPWFTKEIRDQKRIVRNREKIWRKYREEHQWEAFKHEQTLYKNLIKYNKESTICRLVRKCDHDYKKLYTLVSNLTCSVKLNPMPEGDPRLVANNFGDFFVEKIEKINIMLRDKEEYKPNGTYPDAEDRLSTWPKVTSSDVFNTIKIMANKQCESDPIPTSFYKGWSDFNDCYIFDFLADLINASIKQSKFPKCWKNALVKPLIKKSGGEKNMQNYRPVSNLTFISKVIEKIILQELTNHIEIHNLFPEYQSAYQRNFSCEMALAKLTNDILWKFENKEGVALTAIDLSAAFDTVQERILTSVLEKEFCIEGKALEWIKSYLTDRSFTVKVDNTLSDIKTLSSGVPQGSCLGPVLYLCLASTLPLIVNKSININGFADDHSSWKSFDFNHQINQHLSVEDLETNLQNVKCWMDQNRLKMNETKTEFMILSSKNMKEKCSTIPIHVGGEWLDQSDCIKLLGADLDQHLNFKVFIQRKCAKAMFMLKKIRSIRDMLTMDVTQDLMLSLVITHLDYCNHLLYGLPDCDINKLQRIHPEETIVIC